MCLQKGSDTSWTMKPKNIRHKSGICHTSGTVTISSSNPNTEQDTQLFICPFILEPRGILHRPPIEAIL